MSKKLMRKKLALMLANLKKKRPFYTELEYLESEYVGNKTMCWIDTGIYSSEDLTFDVTFSLPLYPTQYGYGNVFGSRLLSTVQEYQITQYNGGSVGIGSRTTSLGFVDANVHRIIYDGGNTITVDGVVKNINKSAITDQSTIGTIVLFAIRQSGIVVQWEHTRIYRCKFGNQRDFIPVLDWNMTPCMYDRVTEQLFYNAGTGNFIAGREIHYVDYLESTGTQYIDTGLNYFADFEVGIKLRNNVSNKALGNTATNCLERNNATAHNWRFSSNGSWDSNIDILEYHIMKWKEDKIYADDVLLTEKVKNKNVGYNMTLFGVGSYYPNIIYFCKLWNPDDGTLVRDFIPAIDENGVGFMFDRVSHTIYDNAGTGVFSYPVRETEYTANAGTLAYIDLGVKYKPSMSIEGKYTRDSYGTQGSVMLLTTTTTAPLIYLPALSGTSTERFVWRRGGYTEQSYFMNNIQYPFTAEIKIDAVNDVLTVNDEIVKTGMIAGMNGYDSPYQSDSNMYIFSIAGTYSGDGKVYYLKITDGTTLLFDLIPAYKDGNAGFYNKIDGAFFKNVSSSGLLTAGKIVEPEYE